MYKLCFASSACEKWNAVFHPLLATCTPWKGALRKESLDAYDLVVYVLDGKKQGVYLRTAFEEQTHEAIAQLDHASEHRIPSFAVQLDTRHPLHEWSSMIPNMEEYVAAHARYRHETRREPALRIKIGILPEMGSVSFKLLLWFLLARMEMSPEHIVAHMEMLNLTLGAPQWWKQIPHKDFQHAQATILGLFTIFRTKDFSSYQPLICDAHMVLEDYHTNPMTETPSVHVEHVHARYTDTQELEQFKMELVDQKCFAEYYETLRFLGKAGAYQQYTVLTFCNLPLYQLEDTLQFLIHHFGVIYPDTICVPGIRTFRHDKYVALLCPITFWKQVQRDISPLFALASASNQDLRKQSSKIFQARLHAHDTVWCAIALTCMLTPNWRALGALALQSGYPHLAFFLGMHALDEEAFPAALFSFLLRKRTHHLPASKIALWNDLVLPPVVRELVDEIQQRPSHVVDGDMLDTMYAFIATHESLTRAQRFALWCSISLFSGSDRTTLRALPPCITTLSSLSAPAELPDVFPVVETRFFAHKPRCALPFGGGMHPLLFESLLCRQISTKIEDPE